MEVTYKQEGDYLIPNIDENQPEEVITIGKFGEMRRKYLQTEKPTKFNGLLLSGELTQHLIQIDRQAKEQLELIMAQSMKKQGITEELKADDEMAWVNIVNNIKAQAEELIIAQLQF